MERDISTKSISGPTQTTSTPIEYLKGVGPQKSSLLKKDLNIFTFGDLLQNFPFRYIDRTQIHKISDITSESQYIQLCGTVENFKLTDKFLIETGSQAPLAIDLTSTTLRPSW